jgi:ribose/xylose/arabinose/galactoside ABC-type transport system permease subunit
MFGISPLGWVHTLGSLPAIPAAVYMLARHGRIVPRSGAGAVYFVSMLIGAFTVFLVAHQPVSYGLGIATLVLLLAGYGVGQLTSLGRAADYIETICLSLTAFLLMLPTVTETLRRVPDGHPLVTDLKSPLLLGAQGSLLVILVVGLAAQMIYLRRQGKAATYDDAIRTY